MQTWLKKLNATPKVTFVNKFQVAELIAFMAKNRGSSYCKVVEVIAETTAPLTPFGELLAKIPSQRVDVSPKESDAADGPDPVPVVSGPLLALLLRRDLPKEKQRQ
ncbi:Protein TIC 62, chloroplastic [Vitis vinifera]|uniref:Protein TIC 62, chloroplastic n=1 Tax=Vitis vinifera TaxID=29760 RepID=A0A438JT94_VITVI|nr:Protein TIC 62, chloroplastic [Vitis vinifera]